ncbi:MAG TPA: hypothetical protein VM263_08865, partial [Acidimicrobiales bacterium]|nr:hypothetical protein [Acidimicrobiales bacterium]
MRLGLALVAGAALAGCGGAGPADPAGSSRDAVLDFYQCLRDGGLDVADPGPGSGIAVRGIDTDDPATRAVVEACAGSRLSGSGERVTVGEGRMGDRLADTRSLITFVDCLRDRGVDIADPSPDGRIPMPRNVDPSAAEFQAATRA